MHIEDPVNIAGKEYLFADLPPVAQKMVTYLQTIDHNLDALDTQMDMMKITRDGCYSRLTKEMEQCHVEEKKSDPAGGIQENPDAA